MSFPGFGHCSIVILKSVAESLFNRLAAGGHASSTSSFEDQHQVLQAMKFSSPES